MVFDDIKKTLVSLTVFRALLTPVMKAGLQPRFFKNLVEHVFAPITEHFRLPFERAGKLNRILIHSLVEVSQFFDFNTEGESLFRLFVVDLVDSLLEFANLVLQWRQQRF